MDDYEDTILSTYVAHHEPYDSPDDVVGTFVRLANSLVGSQLIEGERRELTPDDVAHQMVFDNVGGLVTNGAEEHLGLCVNYRWWDRVGSEEQFVLLLHEVTHIEQAGHPPAFWETALDLYEKAKDQYALVETLFGQPFDWDRADWLFITMPDIPNVDFTHECVPERRQRLATALGYTGDEFDAFELTADRIHLPEYDYTESVPLDKMTVNPVPEAQVYESLTTWLSRDTAEVYVDTDTYEYIIEPPTVRKTGSGEYEVLVGDGRVEFIRRTLGQHRSSPTVPVRINDSEKPT